ncbi:FAD-dependent oxidoreductase (macronuclear) [Tetrahymena thermophila SB210]|uniref:glycerol-3-phosphate dehydrogenase n=1 Tax=Tetrahymena thermophila (strain SB210) TaxID=312017 RepID=Q23AD4_TETTS|nr:FAD-dependent oxidoreductase [Tetrahymena thermophila SB210]EAR93558.2 FAD-dependent oxidoreductase [Tetrahymena thermophila SB210]|eukprot:XP_001013803.2 FAD-dependent oxidoreductase [Tetrahymena thermophila SB210]
MRGFFRMGFNMARKQPLRSWAVPLALSAATGLSYSVYAETQQQNQQHSSSSVVNLNPIKHSSAEPLIKLKTRQDHLADIQKTEEYDIIVIGGGCNGAGVFLEAANRGLKCLLVEGGDFAAATSSKSTKLIHGGIRYLQEVFEFSLKGGRIEKYNLVKEALRERTHFIENAYYMNRQIPFVVPTTNLIMGIYYYIGVLVYHGIYRYYLDSDKSSFRMKMPQWYGGRQLREYFPHLDHKYKYGIVYYDGQFNDTRMNLDILLTGTQHNYNENFQEGNILNYAEVTQLIKDQKTGENKGIVFKDKINGKDISVKGKCIVNCTGAFADNIRKMDDPSCQKRILAVAGSHMTMPASFCSRKHALVIPETQDGRILFLVPWQNHAVVGTTERALDEPELDPTVSAQELIFMSEEVGKIYSNLPSSEITNNINSKWAGLRPLILQNQKEGEPIDTKKIARTHVIEVSKNGLVSLMGGKWTVYRCMGEETVDKILEIFKQKGIKYNENAAKKSSLNLRLLGEANQNANYKFPPKNQYVKIYASALADKHQIEYKEAKYLIKNYGQRAFDILNLAENHTKKDYLKQRVHPNHPILKAEILYHLKYEMAQQPIDVLFRRTRFGFIDRKGMFESLKTVCDIFADELKWDEAKKQKVIEQQKEIMRKMDF